MPECLFCQIAAGEIPAKTVYEDDDVLAFLDINPLAEGHTLVIPKVHAERLGDLDEPQASTYFANVPRIAAAVEKAVGAEGATVAWNDGEAAGQEVPHVHLHIIPRYRADNFGPIHALFEGPQETDLDDVCARIVASLS